MVVNQLLKYGEFGIVLFDNFQVTERTRNQVILHGTEGSNPSLSAKKNHSRTRLWFFFIQAAGLVYHPTQVGISSRARCALVSHHALACIFPAAWWYTTLRVGDIQCFALMISTPSAWFFSETTPSCRGTSTRHGAKVYFYSLILKSLVLFVEKWYNKYKERGITYDKKRKVCTFYNVAKAVWSRNREAFFFTTMPNNWYPQDRKSVV